jgi:phosphopantetheinyl transferase (holo-ACP synthase)
MDIIDINDLRKAMQEKAKEENAEKFIETQHKTIEQLCKQIEALKEKNTHLENVLKAVVKPGLVSEVTQEELICIEQIDIIKNRSSQRELTTDEVKKLDLLIKNLKLLRQESTVIMSKSSYKSLPEDELLALAVSTKDE